MQSLKPQWQSLESQWISENPKKINKYLGQWIAVFKDRGIIASGDTLKEVYKELGKERINQLPLITKLPRKGEGMSIL